MHLAQRVSHVRLLLVTLNDPYPTPHGALRSDPGPAASRYVPCLTCRRRGWIKQRGGVTLCLVCDGRGWKVREHDEEAWDAYVNLPLAEAVQLPVEPSAPATPEIEREHTYGWERQRQSYDRYGSYAELRRALERLEARTPPRARLVRSVLVDGETRQLSANDLLEIDLGVIAIALAMRRVRVPRWLLEEHAADRRETIETLAAQGLRAGEIARKLGIQKRVVRRRLKDDRILSTPGSPFGRREARQG